MLRNLLTRDDHQWWIFSVVDHATGERGQVGADWIPEQFEHLDMDAEGKYTVTITPSLTPLPRNEDNISTTIMGAWKIGRRDMHYTLVVVFALCVGLIATVEIMASDAPPTVEQAQSCIEQQSGDRFSRRSFMACLG